MVAKELRGSVRRQLALLAHRNPTEVVALDTTQTPTRLVDAASLTGVESVVDWIQAHELSSSTLSYFMGVADRRGDFSSNAVRRARLADIAATSAVVLDIDPLRPAGVPADDNGVTAARDAAILLIREMVGRGYLEGHTASSGNGCYVFFPGPRVEYEQAPDFDRRVATLLEQLRPTVETLPVKLDHTQDWPRIIRIIGTQNRKGSDPEKWRYSEWL